MPTTSSNVRVREQSGKHMLVLSSSQFDPSRKWSVRRSTHDNVDLCGGRGAILVCRDHAASTTAIVIRCHRVPTTGDRPLTLPRSPLYSVQMPNERLETLLWGLRRLGDNRQHPDFPIPAFTNINCSPKTGTLNRRPTLVLPRHTRFAHREGRISSERPNLIDGYVQVIKFGLECFFGELCNIRSWPCWIDVHATTCVERSDTCTILPIEALSICRGDLFHLLLKVLVCIGSSRGYRKRC